ncbi:MAG: type 4a pilus biogenesis protein PilO [Succinivibrionaceae bacterium]|nr:type 4a pilus biogenesis protein PilO [Succinivibrionaceae bacterium]
MAMLEDYGNLDYHNPGSFPFVVKALCLVAVMALVLVVAAYAIFGMEGCPNDQIAQKQAEVEKLKAQFYEKAQRANNLEAYEEQKRKLESMLRDQLNMLPNSNEIAQLLSDISKTATDNGLKLEKINWAPEQKKEMYTEIPMDIVIVGDYARMGNFTADVANLSRIVVIEKFDIQHYDKSSDDLKMTMTAKTYKYNEQENKANDKKRGGR